MKALNGSEGLLEIVGHGVMVESVEAYVMKAIDTNCDESSRLIRVPHVLRFHDVALITADTVGQSVGHGLPRNVTHCELCMGLTAHLG